MRGRNEIPRSIPLGVQVTQTFGVSEYEECMNHVLQPWNYHESCVIFHMLATASSSNTTGTAKGSASGPPHGPADATALIPCSCDGCKDFPSHSEGNTA
mmetsp:Transcript_1573/g.9693  ORF Transcript_1573/g.9693 Transcript_1573/m.9693 type:complete len:99 (-) Transcript_1573:599-895(-)